jgi:hypothetical protein
MVIVVLIILSVSFFCYKNINANKEVTVNSQLTINKDVEDYINNIRIMDLSVLKSQMIIGNEDKQGFNFVLSYTLPDGADISSDTNIGLQIEYPEEYFKVLGGNMSAITYFHAKKNSEETSYLTYGAYPSIITDENLNKLISTQYSFKIYIFIDQQIIRELYIQNSLGSSKQRIVSEN